MALQEFRRLMLSPVAITLRVAALSPGFTPEDSHAWVRFFGQAEDVLGKPPEPAPPPTLRWVCKPPDFDPAWTVLTPRWWKSWFPLGGATYNRVTGRSNRGRATRHGRLWNPPEQERLENAWRAENERVQSDWRRIISDTNAAHHAAVADRLERYASTYTRRASRELIRAYRCPPADEGRYSARMLDQHAWLNLTAFREGYIAHISRSAMKENYRPL